MRTRRETKSDTKLSLNPALQEEDRRRLEAILLDPSLKDTLEQTFYSVLNSGDLLRRERCGLNAFKAFVASSKYGATERQTSAALHVFDAHVDESGIHLDFHGFVKCLLHMGYERWPNSQSDDPVATMKQMISEFAGPFNATFRSLNASDGSTPDEGYYDTPDVDRLLYIYDTIFDRIFNRYRDVDQHVNRDLTLEQLKTLDQFIELEELKEFLKDFAFFPNKIAFVEISKCAQMAGFGRIVFDPARVGSLRTSAIDPTAIKRQSLAPGTLVSPARSPNIDSTLHLDALPAELVADEVLLDKPHFMMAMLRIAQALYYRPEFMKRLPSVASRIEEMLAVMAPYYEKTFGRTMESDCDFSERGVPLLMNVGPNVAVQPVTGPLQGGFEVSITGSNFCEKRGVFVRFGEGDSALLVRCKAVQKKRVVVDAPRVTAVDISSHVEFHHGKYVIQLSRTNKLRIECSNNRWQFSVTEPPQFILFSEPFPSFELPVDVCTRLIKQFSSFCSATDRYNTKFLSREAWRKMKALFRLNEMRPGMTVDNDGFFLDVAEFHDGRHDLELNFKSFLRALSRTCFEMFGDEWSARLCDCAAAQATSSEKSGPSSSVSDGDEISVARRSIALVERRSIRELDLYIGPVLCGCLKSTPGDVTLALFDSRKTLRRGHPFLTLDLYDAHAESIVMGHIAASDTYAHLLRRLLHAGFDLACHHTDASTRKPAGRCWNIFSAAEKRIGALWDYPGNYSNLEWQPADQDLYNPHLTMCWYVGEKEPEFVHGYMMHVKAKDVAQMRTLLLARGLSLVTRLYKL